MHPQDLDFCEYMTRYATIEVNDIVMNILSPKRNISTKLQCA